MRLPKRQRFSLWRWLLLGLLPWGTTHAAWEFTQPGDPARHWAISVPVSAGYDDNIFTATSNKQSSVTASVNPTFTLGLPRDQTTVQLRYSYAATYYERRPGNNVDQSHSADVELTHNFSTRLAVSLGDTFRYGLEPGLVNLQAGVPIITHFRGDYFYNNTTAAMTYELTRRWNLAVNESWDRWRYVDKTEAGVNDRDSYGTTFSAIYGLDTRSSLGGSYRLTLNQYASAGVTNDTRNSTAHTIFLSYVRRFNPQLSIQVNPGFEIEEFGDGTQSASPSVNLSATYTYGPQSLAGAGFAYYLSATEVAAYRSAESAVMYLNLQHRLSTKLRAALDFSYVISTFGSVNPLAGNQPSGVREDSWHAALSCGYDFTNWAKATLSYEFDQVISDLSGRGFDRSRVSLGAGLQY